MTTWYIDPVNGTDANASAGNGDSFSTRRKRIDNLVAAAIAPGDTCRIMGSPDATSLGVTGAWTQGPYSSVVAITSSTNATPIVMTLSAANYALLSPSVNDTVVVNGHATNTNSNGVWDLSAVDAVNYKITLVNADASNSVGNGVGGATGTVRKVNSCRVKLASALTKTVALTGNKGTKTNWTASANVTCTTSTADYKEGAECQSIAIAAGFVTGLAAYYPLGSAIDYSSYQQCSFWIKQTAGTIGAAGSVTLTLCSDTAGATPVSTFNIPALGALNRWVPVTVDKGSSLGVSIQSVAFNVVTDNGAQTFLIDNIQAGKASSSADSITLQSLIGKATTGGEFYGIQSINGTRVMLDQDTNTIPASAPARGYFGATETVTTYKRETFKTTLAATNTAAVQTIQDSGSAGSLITFTGGWNTTDMSTQTMETWFDGLNGFGAGLRFATKDYLEISNIGCVRYYYATQGNSSAAAVDTIALIAANNCTSIAVVLDITGSSITLGSVNNCAANGIQLNLASSNTITITNLFGNAAKAIDLLGDINTITCSKIAGSGSVGISMSNAYNNNITVTSIVNSGTAGIAIAASCNNRIKVGSISSSATSGITIDGTSSGNIIYDTSFSSNTNSSIALTNSFNKNYLRNCTLSDSPTISGIANSLVHESGLYSHNDGNTPNVYIQTLSNGVIKSEATVRHTASGISWKLSPNNTTYVTSLAPFFMPVAQVACGSGTLVTATLWMYRDNAGLSARFTCKGGQIAGVDADVSTAMTVGANTWEQVTITFTPSEIGVVELVAECWGGTTYNLYVDDFDVTQA